MILILHQQNHETYRKIIFLEWRYAIPFAIPRATSWRRRQIELFDFGWKMVCLLLHCWSLTSSVSTNSSRMMKWVPCLSDWIISPALTACNLMTFSCRKLFKIFVSKPKSDAAVVVAEKFLDPGGLSFFMAKLCSESNWPVIGLRRYTRLTMENPPVPNRRVTITSCSLRWRMLSLLAKQTERVLSRVQHCSNCRNLRAAAFPGHMVPMLLLLDS